MSEKAIKVTDANFREVILDAKLPVLLEAWHPGCGPCKPFAAIVEQTATEFEGRMIVAQMNLEEAPISGAELGVSAVPAVMFILRGEKIKHVAGGYTMGQMREMSEFFLRFCAADAEARRVHAEALRAAEEKFNAGKKAWSQLWQAEESKYPESQKVVELGTVLYAYIDEKMLASEKAGFYAGKISEAAYKSLQNIAFNKLMHNPPEEMQSTCAAFYEAMMNKMTVLQPVMDKLSEQSAEVYKQYHADIEDAERRFREMLAS